MKNYLHAIQYQKLNKKRMFCAVLLVLWMMVMPSLKEEGDIFYKMTTQMLPLLTYEREYGLKDIDYAADYQVPEWFYEDEGVTMGSDAVENIQEEAPFADENNGESQQVEQENTEESITTLADGKRGTVYSREQLQSKDFLLSKIFVVDSNTGMTEEELNLENLLNTDLSVPGLKDWNQDNTVEKKECKILIYHTHASESFKDSRAGMQEDTIVGVGSYLAEILEKQYGIPVYHDTTAYDVIDGVLDRNKAYENAYNNVSRILAENPSIEVVIDLHRDGVDEDTHLVTEMNGKKTAKIMFLNGVSRSNMNGEIEYLKNPHKLANLAFSFQLYLTGKEYYGDYVRKIYVKSLRFNLHLMPRTTLIEAGAQTNTLEEEKNAMEPLAAILNHVLSGEEATPR